MAILLAGFSAGQVRVEATKDLPKLVIFLNFLELVVVSSVCRGLAGINILGSAFDRMGARLKVFDESESFSVHIVYCLFYIFSS